MSGHADAQDGLALASGRSRARLIVGEVAGTDQWSCRPRGQAAFPACLRSRSRRPLGRRRRWRRHPRSTRLARNLAFVACARARRNHGLGRLTGQQAGARARGEPRRHRRGRAPRLRGDDAPAAPDGASTALAATAPARKRAGRSPGVDLDDAHAVQDRAIPGVEFAVVLERADRGLHRIERAAAFGQNAPAHLRCALAAGDADGAALIFDGAGPSMDDDRGHAAEC